MPQFDIHKNPRRSAYPLLLVVQAELLDSLGSRVVVPLIARKRMVGKPITRLDPIIDVEGVAYVAVVQEMAAISRRDLGERVGSAAPQRAEIVAALDLLLTGA